MHLAATMQDGQKFQSLPEFKQVAGPAASAAQLAQIVAGLRDVKGRNTRDRGTSLCADVIYRYLAGASTKAGNERCAKMGSVNAILRTRLIDFPCTHGRMN